METGGEWPAASPVAHCDRPPRPNGLHAARLVSGLWSSPRSTRTDSAPSQTLKTGSVAIAEFSTPLPLRGQRRILTGFPNYPARDWRAGTFNAAIILEFLSARHARGYAC